MEAARPQALHIATEGPLGLAARAAAIRNHLPFTSAYHTRFPEYVHARLRIPLSTTYRFLKWFHQPSRAVLVPTRAVKADLEAAGFDPGRVVMWSRGVDLDVFSPGAGAPNDLRPPVFLYVGRLAVEKNVEAFLRLDLPGSKWVAGDGPLASRLKRDYPEVRFTGVLDQRELARVYNAADVFVFPSRTDTFGLVILEALACGCPVAAYPVTGPIDVVARGRSGCLDEDLRKAALGALDLDRDEVAHHARDFSWGRATAQFLSHLHPEHARARHA